MSKTTLMNNLSRIKKDIADLTKKISQESKKENDASKRILQVEKSITKNTSPRLLNSKLSEINRKQGEITKIQKKKASLQKKEADITNKLHKYQIDLQREEERERKILDTAENKRQNNQISFQRKLRQEIESTKLASVQLQSSMQDHHLKETQYDLFISQHQTIKKI